MDPIEQLRQSFLIEAEELVLVAEQSLSQLQNGSDSLDAIASAFRAIHSIKGGAGAFGFQNLVAIAHSLEAALDHVRSGKHPAGAPLPVPLFIRGVDAIGGRLACLKEGSEPSNIDALIAELDAYVRGGHSAPQPLSLPVQEAPRAAGTAKGMTITLKPADDLFRRVVEPRHLFQRLENFGAIEPATFDDAVPLLDDIDPLKNYLRFSCNLASDVAVDTVHDICLQMFEEDEFTIDAAHGQTLPVAAVPSRIATPAPSAAVSEKSEPLAQQTARTLGLPPGRAATTTIRVDLERIDKLMNLVGEIVITQSILNDRINSLPSVESMRLADGVEALSRQMRELQDNVMAVRAQPVKTVFQRIPRMVRDLSETLKKDVRVEISGENTEIDKTIIEELTDPLIHMIRNSMDHGIEPVEERIASGKPAQGTIAISAEQKNGRIFITITDDGRGINRERLLQKAVAQGIVPGFGEMPPADIDNLIFHAGLSTAAAVTDVSGRGVGMDVVRRNVEALGGRIFVESQPGRGCVFSLVLPLTLAVLEGMIVRVGAQRVVIPITTIIETCRKRDHLCQTMPNGAQVMRFRGQLAPMWDLGAILDVEHSVEERVIVVVENENGKIICLNVDEIIGQQQVVVKSLEVNYRRVPGASSATILGDGLVALILDVNLMSAPAPSVNAQPLYRDVA